MSDELPYPPPPSGPPSPDPGPEGDQHAPAAPAAPVYAEPAAPPPTPYAAPTQPPPPAYAPTPGYAAPAYGYPPPPGRPRNASNLWMIITAVVVVALLLVGAIAYVVAGYAFASSRISDASSAINGASAHRSYVNTTFDLLDQQVTSFAAMTDATLSKSTAGQLVSESQSISAIVGGDDHAMAAARSHLRDQQWLTAISSGRLDDEAGRIDHARKATDAVKSAAGGYVLLGQFYQSFFQALIDWSTMLVDAKNNDFVGTSTQDALIKTDAINAQQLAANAPGLPSQYHDFLVILQSYAADVAKELNARTSADFDAADKQAVADVNAMGAVDFSGTPAKIKAYYQHYRDDFNAEMDRATV
ncbi:MAG TPA: hypothetical protein VF956_07485 [Candidatus Dormibacteraeota bacterium]